jgi:hypothetical protein
MRRVIFCLTRDTMKLFVCRKGRANHLALVLHGPAILRFLHYTASQPAAAAAARLGEMRDRKPRLSAEAGAPLCKQGPSSLFEPRQHLTHFSAARRTMDANDLPRGGRRLRLPRKRTPTGDHQRNLMPEAPGSFPTPSPTPFFAPSFAVHNRGKSDGTRTTMLAIVNNSDAAARMAEACTKMETPRRNSGDGRRLATEQLRHTR